MSSDSRSRRSAASASSNWSWVGAAAVVVGGALLVRTVMRGTAPSNTSNYTMYRNSVKSAPEMPPNWRRVTPEQRPEPGTVGAGGRRATPEQQQQQASYTQYKQQQDQQKAEERADEQWEQHQRERAYDASQNAAGSIPGTAAYRQQSDFARYDAFQQAAREHFASQMAESGTDGSDFRPLGEVDRDFEFSKEQARADYVQSKFLHIKKSSKSIKRYESWSGPANTAADADDMTEADFASRDEQHGEAQSAFKSVQRQLATQPRFVLARQLLFAPLAEASAASAAASNSEPAATTSSLFLRSSTIGQAPAAGPLVLTVRSVRTAYFSRAKDCHPDVPGGGNKEQFQRLTDAYDLLISTLAPLEARKKPQSSAQSASG